MNDETTPEALEQLAGSVAMSGVLGDRDRLDVVTACSSPTSTKPKAVIRRPGDDLV